MRARSSARTVDRRRYDRTRMSLSEADFVDSVINWYRASARDLPWRETRDPYAILVSEIMLQQTQVEPRRGALQRVARALADARRARRATPGDVIAAWSGLGYNNRAVRLHAAAAPGRPRRLAGDVRGPAGAARRRPVHGCRGRCLAFGADRLPVDVNIRRVLHRALERERSRRAPAARPSSTQALFDLGATVCIARRPRCGACPLAADCPRAG